MLSTAALIVNGKSRRGREWYEEAKATLEKSSLHLKQCELIRNPKQIEARIQQAIHDQIPLICVGGGDGTLSLVARHFIDSEAVLGVLPLGTGNSLARDLGIPANVQKACEIVLEGAPKAIDLGEVNGRTFVNVATIGLTTRIAEILDPDAKKRFGRAVYIVAIFKAVASHSPFLVDLEIEGEQHQFRTVQIVVGSGRYHGGPFPILPDASIRSGKLAGYVVTGTTRMTLIRYAWRLMRGRLADLPEVFPFEVEELSLSTIPRKRITIDGEVKMSTPAKFRSIPQAIRVMLPQEANLGPEI